MEVTHKLDLYNAGKAAFGGAGGEAARREAFRGIYENLRRYWQIFRDSKSYWNADQIFDALASEFQPYSRADGATLSGLGGDDRVGLLKALRALRDLKSGRYYPTMAVSKFLHFFNPMLFPIYDNAIIQDEIIGPGGRFHDEYWSFARQSGLDHLDKNNDFYLRYVAWGRSLIRPESERVMPVFAEWFREEVRRPPRPSGRHLRRSSLRGDGVRVHRHRGGVSLIL